jgi:hypothetical protein
MDKTGFNLQITKQTHNLQVFHLLSNRLPGQNVEEQRWSEQKARPLTALVLRFQNVQCEYARPIRALMTQPSDLHTSLSYCDSKNLL